MIETVVIVSAIAIFLTVRLIVFLIETNAVAKGKSVVRRHQIDRGERFSPLTLKHIAGGGKSSGKLTQRQTPFKPQTARRIAEMIVPFRKWRREIPHLIAAFTDVPRFSDQLHARKYRTVFNRLQQRRLLAERRRSAHHRSQIEAETVDMESLNPVFQA